MKDGKQSLFVVTYFHKPRLTLCLGTSLHTCGMDWALCFTDRPLLCASAVVLELPESLAITGGYAQQYRAVQLHLHWGSPSGPGSEHTVNGHRFAAEVRSPHGSGCILSSTAAGQGNC